MQAQNIMSDSNKQEVLMANHTTNRKIKKLYLSSGDKKISGLCGGIASYFEIDSSLIRLAWIILTIITGIVPGILAYIIAVIVIPREGDKVAG